MQDFTLNNLNHVLASALYKSEKKTAELAKWKGEHEVGSLISLMKALTGQVCHTPILSKFVVLVLGTLITLPTFVGG